MKHFHLDSSMRTMTGVFYPTGYMVLMFPTEQAARDAARRLEDNGFPEDGSALITPEDFRRQIAGATGDQDALPSPGTEGDTVRRFLELARQGHYGLLVHAPSHKEHDRALSLLKGSGISYGQYYRKLVIEDVVT